MKSYSKKTCMIALRHAALDARVFYKEAKTLQNAGYEVHYMLRLPDSGVFTDMGGNEVGKLDYNGKWNFEGVIFHGIKKRPKSLWGKYQEYRDIVRTGLDIRADVYHCHDTDVALAAAIAIKKKLGSKTKFIFDSHEFWAGRWAYHIFKRAWKVFFPLCKFLEKWALKDSDAFIASDFPTLGVLQQYNLNRKSILIYNTPLVSFFDQSDIHYLPSKKNDKTIIMHSGTMSKTRGLDRLIKLLNNSDGSIALEVHGGIIPTDSKEKISIDKLIKEGKIIDKGHVDYKDLGKSLHGGAFGISILENSPNFITAAPNKIFHYMYAGLAIIADNYPGMSEIIQKYKCGLLIRPDNEFSLKNAVEYLKEHPEVAKAMGERGRQAILNELCWEKHGHKLVDFYREILDDCPFIF